MNEETIREFFIKLSSLNERRIFIDSNENGDRAAKDGEEFLREIEDHRVNPFERANERVLEQHKGAC